MLRCSPLGRVGRHRPRVSACPRTPPSAQWVREGTPARWLCHSPIHRTAAYRPARMTTSCTSACRPFRPTWWPGPCPSSSGAPFASLQHPGPLTCPMQPHSSPTPTPTPLPTQGGFPAPGAPTPTAHRPLPTHFLVEPFTMPIKRPMGGSVLLGTQVTNDEAKYQGPILAPAGSQTLSPGHAADRANQFASPQPDGRRVSGQGHTLARAT